MMPLMILALFAAFIVWSVIDYRRVVREERTEGERIISAYREATHGPR